MDRKGNKAGWMQTTGQAEHPQGEMVSSARALLAPEAPQQGWDRLPTRLWLLPGGQNLAGQ